MREILKALKIKPLLKHIIHKHRVASQISPLRVLIPPTYKGTPYKHSFSSKNEYLKALRVWGFARYLTLHHTTLHCVCASIKDIT